MKGTFFYSVKMILSIAIVLIYLLFSGMVYIGLDNPSIVTVIRHVILVPGLVPVMCWLTFLILRKPLFDKKLFLLSIFFTFSHVVVFAISAHKDGLVYWMAQSFEVTALWFVYRPELQKGAKYQFLNLREKQK